MKDYYIYILEIRVRNKPSPTLPKYHSRIQVILIIFQLVRKIVLTITGKLKEIIIVIIIIIIYGTCTHFGIIWQFGLNDLTGSYELTFLNNICRLYLPRKKKKKKKVVED